MADIQHATLTDDRLHYPKGASGAANDTWLKANGDGTTSFSALPPAPDRVLKQTDNISGEAIANQYLSSVGQEAVALFGPAQDSVGGSMSLAADGTLTFNQDGVYEINSSAIAGRTTSVGVVDLIFSIRLNGVQAGRTFALSLDSASDTFVAPLTSTFTIEATAGDLLTHHFARHDGDTSGDAGLKLVPVAGLSGWSDAAPASLRIAKIEVV